MFGWKNRRSVRLYRIWVAGKFETHILATSPEVVADYINVNFKNEDWYGTGSEMERTAKRAEIVRKRGEQYVDLTGWVDHGVVHWWQIKTLQRLRLAGEVYDDKDFTVTGATYYDIYPQFGSDPSKFVVGVYDQDRIPIGYVSRLGRIKLVAREKFDGIEEAHEAAKALGLIPYTKPNIVPKWEIPTVPV